VPIAYGVVESRELGSNYLLDAEIGRGGMGVVWRGTDRRTGTVYAIKLLRPELSHDPDALTRFVRERTALLSFRHPNVVTVHDMIVEGEQLGLVMDLVTGGDLAKHRTQCGGRLDPAPAAVIFEQICDGLAAAHAAGIVHRDLKPANVLLTPSGEVRLADFGIARVIGGTRATSTGSFLGTAAYIAPEVISGGEAGPPCDVYAAGITLYELLAGQPPFTGHVAAVMQQHMQAPPPELHGVPPWLRDLVFACLAKDPAARPAARDVVSRIRGLNRTSYADLEVNSEQTQQAFSVASLEGDPLHAVPVDMRGPVDMSGAVTPVAPATALAPATAAAPATDAMRGGLARRRGGTQPSGRRRSPRAALAAAAALVLIAAIGVTVAVLHSTSGTKLTASTVRPAISSTRTTSPTRVTSSSRSPSASRSSAPSSRTASVSPGQAASPTAGASTPASTPTATGSTSPASAPEPTGPNLITDPDFCDSTFGDWTYDTFNVVRTTPGVNGACAAAEMTTGSASGSVAGVGQTITGLTVGDSYVFSGYVDSQDSGITMIGIDDYSSTDPGGVGYRVTDSGWEYGSMTITAESTSLHVWCWRYDGAGTGSCSSLSLRQMS
jgi:serine/threonine-protein kinase